MKNKIKKSFLLLNEITFIVTSPQHVCLGEWSGLWNPAPDIAAEIFVQHNVHTTTTTTKIMEWSHNISNMF